MNAAQLNPYDPQVSLLLYRIAIARNDLLDAANALMIILGDRDVVINVTAAQRAWAERALNGLQPLLHLRADNGNDQNKSD